MEASSGDEQPSSEGTGVLTGPESELSAGEPARDLEAAVEKITGPVYCQLSVITTTPDWITHIIYSPPGLPECKGKNIK